MKNNTVLMQDVEGVYHKIDREHVIFTAKDLISESFYDSSVIDSPRKLAEGLHILLADLEHEVFYCMFLNTAHQVIKGEILFTGTLTNASVYPREVVKKALGYNAHAVIFAHNHPSGDNTPSRADIKITERLKAALDLVDVKLLDHFVIGKTSLSMAEENLI